jgi:hypothetical protein
MPVRAASSNRNKMSMMATMCIWGGRTVGLSTITVSDLHGSSANAAYAEIGFPGGGSTLLTWRGAIDGSETGLKKNEYNGKRGAGKTDLVKGMAALGNNVRLLAWEPETEAEGLEADGTLVVVVWCRVV